VIRTVETEIDPRLDVVGFWYKVRESLLRSVIPEQIWSDIFWGLSIGSISGVLLKTETTAEFKGKKIKVALYLDKNITPQEITFELRKK